MLLSFLTRFFSSKKPQLHKPVEPNNDNTPLKIFVQQEGGKFFSNFQLYHQNTVTSIDTLIFLPHFGIFLGETINWRTDELENATVERSSVQMKRPATTHFTRIESKIRRKLEDVLSFDSTPIERFIWMKNLTESEFDALDSSFHELLPKGRLFFSDETAETVKTKLYSLGEYRYDPYSTIKVIGALQSHTYILPTPFHPSGALLSPQQTLFLTSEHEGNTTLAGGYGSGKSTLLIRKALLHILARPHEEVMIITPTLLGGELLRNELVSLLEYSALSIDLGAIHFYNPVPSNSGDIDRLEDLKNFQEASLVLCDDAHLLEESFINKLYKYRGKHSLLLASTHAEQSDNVFELSGHFRRMPTPRKLSSPHRQSIITLVLRLRKLLAQTQTTDIMIMVSDEHDMISFKEGVDEYFHLNCRILLPSFSLQYQNLDSIIITTMECIAPLSRAHVILVGIDPNDTNYSLALSRASETLTIISEQNPSEKTTI